jgi:predicted GIY-YIG superfamily endonuclease
LELERNLFSRTIIIYVLKLEHGNYYVGQTTNLKRRLKEHNDGRRGSDWTRLHKLVHHIESIDSKMIDSKKAAILENEIVLKYMGMYGWKKVRGGYFNLIDEEVTYKTLLKRSKKDEIYFELQKPV